MSFFTWLRMQIWPLHHRNDPRMHDERMIEDDPDDWDPGSTAKYLSVSHLQWIDSVIKQASKFPAECFIQFQFHPLQHTIICYRVERADQPRLELGMVERIEQSYWERFWRFLYDRFDSSLAVEPLAGEKKRELCLWISPRKNSDPYSVNPNAVCVRLCVDYPTKTTGRTCRCSLDGPCTAH